MKKFIGTWTIVGFWILLSGCGSSDREVILSAIPERPDLSGWPDRLFMRIENAEMRSLNGDNPLDGLAELSRIYHANGFLDEAMQCYRALSALDSSNATWRQLISLVQDAKNSDEDAWDPEDPLVLQLYSDCFDSGRLLRAATDSLEAGNSGAALRVLGRALQLSPGDASLHFQIGKAYHKTGNLTQAEKAYRTCLALDPKYIEGWVHIADLYLQMGKQDLQKRTLIRALQLNPDSAKLKVLVEQGKEK